MFLIISFLLLEGSSSKKRTRGPTRNLDLLGMKPEEKKQHISIEKAKLFIVTTTKDFLVTWGHWYNLNTMYPSKSKIGITLVKM